MDNVSLIRRLSQIGTVLATFLSGQLVGIDTFGNCYYRTRKPTQGVREKRWVIYAGEPEASKVPPEWHIWLHHTASAPLSNELRKSWQKPHLENMTGTPEAWMPPALSGHDRPKATGDYEAWQPEI